MPIIRLPSYLKFNKKNYPWKADIDYRKNPNLYKVGKGEQGVLVCNPYKNEILPHWKFKNPEIAAKSSQQILKMFYAYLEKNDFVGADLARKFLQMGYTRSRRYANYKGGKKYDKDKNYTLLEKGTGEKIKAESAAIFYSAWQEAEAFPLYAEQKIKWKKELG